jgi:glutamine---fructose-6-phosphate transaminase (isomerizing)
LSEAFTEPDRRQYTGVNCDGIPDKVLFVSSNGVTRVLAPKGILLENGIESFQYWRNPVGTLPMIKNSEVSSSQPIHALSRPGENTLAEIFAQPRIWKETEERLLNDGTLERLAQVYSPRSPWLFVGCGSSYYLSRLIAAVWTKHFYIPATGVPASELLFAPDGTIRRIGAEQIVLMSRSGETTEVLRVAELLQAHKTVQTLAVTCNPDSVLQNLCTHTFKLDWADEKSTVMTGSFTAILLAFQRLGLHFISDEILTAALAQLPKVGQAWLDANAKRIQEFAGKRKFADYVFLGQGAHYWLAQEAGLKITEMSSSYAQVYHSMEFRHGPRSIAGPDTLITFYVSDAAEEAELTLARELKELGAAVCIIVNHASDEVKSQFDLVLELGMDGPESARYALAAMPAHLFGTAVGLRKGLNPDAPRNLTRAVVLPGRKKPSAKRK